MLATYNITGEWFSNLEELVEHIEGLGYEVLEANGEYIDVLDPEVLDPEEDNQYVVYLGGTEKTIIIKSIELA